MKYNMLQSWFFVLNKKMKKGITMYTNQWISHFTKCYLNVCIEVEVIICTFVLLVGYIKNTFAKSTVGLTYFGCDPFFWTGYLDDVSALM